MIAIELLMRNCVDRIGLIMKRNGILVLVLKTKCNLLFSLSNQLAHKKEAANPLLSRLVNNVNMILIFSFSLYSFIHSAEIGQVALHYSAEPK